MTDQQGWGPPQQQQPSWNNNGWGLPAPEQERRGLPPQPRHGQSRGPQVRMQPSTGYSYQPPQQGYPPMGPGPQWPKKRHTIRNVILGATGAIVLIIIIATVANASHTTGRKQPAASGTGAPKAVSTPNAPSYTAAETKWYNAVLAKYPQISGGTEAQIVSLTKQVCKAREAGGSQAQLVSATAGKLGTSARSFVRGAEKAMCPSQLPVPPQVLLNFSGSGIENSAPFLVNSSQVTVTYNFNCSSFGSSGNFIADLEYGNQTSMNSDDQPIANQLAPSGQTTTTVYPQDPGNDYYVAVNSECSWSVKVESP
jgi:hypothetical protein